MNYLSVEQASKSYGVRVLFQDINFGINQGDKIALVAKNGTGKTSLLNIITGKDIPDKGTISIRKEIKMAYLPQEPQFNEEQSVMETIYQSDNELLRAVKAYEEALELSQHDASDANLELLNNATSRMDQLNAWNYENAIQQILFRLQITFLDKQIKMLSGGQKKRVALARILISEPDLLIMDEPTNHLDMEMVEWLEDYLSNKDLSLLMVTHDRYFLDRVCNQLLELENGKLYGYKGNYSYYVEKKAERELAQDAEVDKARNLYRRELEWVRKMPKARGTKAKARVNAFDDVEAKAKQRKSDDKLQLDVKSTRLGGKILELIKLNKSFGSFPILKSFTYTFKHGEKIGIVGKNGVGKTTVLNMIMGLEGYDGGKIQTGETVVFGYYSQQGMIHADDKRVIEVVKEIAEFIPMADGSKLSASQLLQRFLFSNEQQYTMVGKLSGGERRRLYLMTILIRNPNFLILDEPTNDLDIVTLSILEDFLVSFKGCVLIVSHDRYFMDRLVDHLFVFEGDGEIKDFPGNYTQYREYLEAKQEKEREQKQELASAKVEEKKEKPVQSTSPVAVPAVRKLTYKEKLELEGLEKEIAQLEQSKLTLTEKLNSGTGTHVDLKTWADELSVLIEKLDEKSMRWLELSEVG